MVTTLTAKQLDHYRRLLLDRRREILGDLDALEDEASEASPRSGAQSRTHLADVGTDAFDQDMLRRLAANDRQRLWEIDEALRRIDAGTYGTCRITGRRIPKARLDASPWATTTVEAERELEEHPTPD